MSKGILITKPFIPDYKEVEKLLGGIWARNWWTNDGPLIKAYASELSSFLQVEDAQVVGNGTLALQLAIKALGLKGNVLTTPFSYVATTSSLVWEGLEPVFVDIDPDTLNINPARIENAIDEHTTAILATHCFGNPCAIDEIAVIAERHGLKVMYDGAHALGARYREKSVFDFGDVTALSLHATKPIHCVEGGAVIAKDPILRKRIFYMHNFGHDGPEKFNGLGINAKNSELHAAVGLVVLKHAASILDHRKHIVAHYKARLEGKGIGFQVATRHGTPNHSYFPVLFSDEKELLNVVSELEKEQIHPRRYFYPPLHRLPYVNAQKSKVPIAEDVSCRVLCLPLYTGLSQDDVDLICDTIIRALRTIRSHATVAGIRSQENSMINTIHS